MKKFIPAFLFLFSLFTHQSFSQYKKANSYYENLYYAQAIPLYKKSLKGESGKEAMEKLAHCYRKINNYKEAETYYSSLIASGDVKPVNYLYYGEVLMNNSKYDEAEEQFLIYASLVPNDNKGKLLAKSSQEIKKLLKQPAGFIVYNLEELNSPFSDFSAVYYNNGVIFVSERDNDYVNRNKSGYNNSNYLSVFYSKAKADSLLFKDAVKFSHKINTELHNGPVSFNKDQDFIVFTRVKKGKTDNKENISRPNIFMASRKGNKWSNIKGFPYNSNEYSNGHPALSSDGKLLYFTSDKPGGFGGSDIYVSKKQDGGWGEPVNLGPEINTPLNESFPYISKSGMLYFSSDGHPGFGGLDVFSAEIIDSKWVNVKNLLAPVNSPADDFGIVYDPQEKRGYFSSNREGGKGKDDIYGFYQFSRFISVSGKILLSDNIDDPASSVKVLLFTDEGVLVHTTTTDNSGLFKFENLSPDQKYLVRLEENDPGLPPNQKIFLTDKNGNIIKKTSTDVKGHFIFSNLPADAYYPGYIVEDDTKITLSGSILTGDSPLKPLAGQTINLLNEDGEVVQTATTDKYGTFKFENLPPDQKFLVNLNAEDTKLSPNTKIVVTDKRGKRIFTTITGNNGEFNFEVLSTEDNVLRLMDGEDTALRIDLKGKLMGSEDGTSPVANSRVNLVNDKGEVVQTVTTDADGNFKFVNLPPDQNFLVSIDQNDAPLNLNQVFLMDEKGKVIRKFIFEKGKYLFEVLPTDHPAMASIYVEDPWLKMEEIKTNKKDSIIIIENVYYEYGKWNILPEAATVLDKVVQTMRDYPDIYIELSAHTDSRSTADFNLELSKKRAKAAVAYIISKGVSSKRISGIGMGESRLFNYCTDDVECSEEQHAQNRRTEFQVINKKK